MIILLTGRPTSAIFTSGSIFYCSQANQWKLLNFLCLQSPSFSRAKAPPAKRNDGIWERECRLLLLKRPGFDCQTSATMTSYLGSVCWFSTTPRGFPPGIPVFPSPQKPAFDLNWVNLLISVYSGSAAYGKPNGAKFTNQKLTSHSTSFLSRSREISIKLNKIKSRSTDFLSRLRQF